jgi:hypothetical protein
MLESPATARPANARIPLATGSAAHAGSSGPLGPQPAGLRRAPLGARPAAPAGGVAPFAHRLAQGRTAQPGQPRSPSALHGGLTQLPRLRSADRHSGRVSCTCNVVREIPNVDNLRPLWTASQAKTFFCTQPVDGVFPGRRVLRASRTRISTAPSPCCAQRGRRVCTGYPQACAQQRWTPTSGHARLSEP